MKTKVTAKGTCAKNKEHDYKEIYSFLIGDEYSLNNFWRIYRCTICRNLKLLTGAK